VGFATAGGDGRREITMAERMIGTVVHRRDLSPILSILRLVPEDGSEFPRYLAGQYIALRRENCRLTKKTVGKDGKIEFVPDLDENGRQRRGAVSHAYSISSAPFETRLSRYLEFYVVLHIDDRGQPGRLSESLFQMDSTDDRTISYFYKITGDFTLEKRASGFQNVVMIGTGSGLAPFAAMIKQLHYNATQGSPSDVRYTLFHGNRSHLELGYHDELAAIALSGTLDLVYVPTVSRPSKQDLVNPDLGKGRANNLVRRVFGMPLKEEEDLAGLSGQGPDTTQATASLQVAVRPILPSGVSESGLRERMDPRTTVFLTCGNPTGMADVKRIAERQGIRFELEEW
jgi:ferredoxin-NADP reductase